jgi:hypothetical protein
MSETFTRVILGKYKYWEWTKGSEGKERGQVQGIVLG